MTHHLIVLFVGEKLTIVRRWILNVPEWFTDRIFFLYNAFKK